MKTLILLISISILAFSPVSCFSDTRNDIPISLAEKYVALSGISETLDGIPTQVDALGKQRLLTAKDRGIEMEVFNTIKNAYNSRQIRERVLNFIRSNATRQQLDDLLKWQDSALTRKMVAAELQINNADAQSEMLHFIADLQKSPPPAERTQTIQHFVSATRMPEFLTDITVGVTESMLTGFYKAGLGDGKLSKEQLGLQIESIRSTVGPAMEQQAVLMSYYTYRNISNEDINRYADFYQTTLGQFEIDLQKKAIMAAISTWAEQTANDLTPLIERKKQQKN